MIVPVRKDKAWWWTLGEITLDWIDVSSGSKIFQDPNGDPLTVLQGDSFRLVYFDSIGMQKGEEEDDEDGAHESTKAL